MNMELGPASDTDDDLHCPVCDYALRGLPEPRCPECGYAFQWAELRERQRLKQGWFYEHAGTLRSHLKTRWRSLRPWSFWKQIHAYTDADSRRLWRYRATTLALLLLVAAAVTGVVAAEDVVRRAAMNAIARPTINYSLTPIFGGASRPIPSYRFRSIPPSLLPPGISPTSTQPIYYYVVPPAWWVRLGTTLNPRSNRFSTAKVGVVLLATLGMPLLLPAYWVLLRRSVLKAAVRPVHLARVQAYTADALPLLLVLAVAADVAWAVLVPDVAWRRSMWTLLAPSLVPGVVVVGGLTLRLASALRQYLRFPHAVAVALAFGAIALLAWLTVVVPVRIEF